MLYPFGELRHSVNHGHREGQSLARNSMHNPISTDLAIKKARAVMGILIFILNARRLHLGAQNPIQQTIDWVISRAIDRVVKRAI
jgi:hypothetical protein